MRWILGICVLGLSACSQPVASSPQVQVPVKVELSLQQLQQVCLDYQSPPSQVVYTEEPAFVASHVRGKDGYEYIAIGSEKPRPYRVNVVHMPVAPWNQFCAQAQKLGIAGVSTNRAEVRPLVHGMKTADGRQWLVTMVLFPYSSQALEFSAYMMEPLKDDNPEQKPVMEQIVRVPIPYVPPLEGKALRLYGAQFFEENGSWFTMLYEVNGEQGTMRWDLEAKPSPQLKVEIVSGPLKTQ